MNYNVFLDGISNYMELWEKGLKKQANKCLKDFIDEFSNNVQEEVQKEIIFKFLMDFCEDNTNQFNKISDGDLPYFLGVYVMDYLHKECEEDKMPQLRWCYELGGEYEFSKLERAYASPQCDKKTVELMITHYTNILFWGAHHFPENSCIEKEGYEDAITNCKRIILEKEVDRELQEEVEYYEKIYNCYYEFEANNREKPFSEYCKEAGIEEL